MPLRLIAFVAGALTALTAVALSQDREAVKLYASRDVDDRIEAVRRVGRGSDPKDVSLVLKALGDRDWEVAEVAAEVAAKRAFTAAIGPLAKVAMKGPVRRLRQAAARALSTLGAADATASVTKRLRKSDAPRVIDAMRLIGGDHALARLEKYAASRDPEVKQLALCALGDVGGPKMFPRLEEMLGHDDVRVRIAACRGLARTGTEKGLSALLQAYDREQMPLVEERRIRYAIRAFFEGLDAAPARDARFGAITAALGSRSDSLRGARWMRLLGELGRGEPVVTAKTIADALERGLGFDNADIRRAALAALGVVGATDKGERVVELAATAPSARTRLLALRCAVGVLGAKAEKTAVALLRDRDATVRGDAAALCGAHHYTGAGPGLLDLLRDSSWEVAVAATVSLGRIRHREAAPELRGMLTHRDWKYRGAAAVALGWFRDVESTELLIERLADRDASVRATILQVLERITGQKGNGNRKQWQAWWRKNRAGFQFIDRGAEALRAREQGYATDYGVYKDLDVIVLDTRAGGDNIEHLLERMNVAHRLTRAGQVSECGLHPFAIFVANCSGEINADDVERVNWFVRVGGYLFSSCWALTHTVERAFTDVVTKHPTNAQVMDVVEAEPLPSGSERFLRGVFRPGTQTRYVLEGSHLIRVLDQERFEVLIDSPQCAARWGEGNLAGWFTVGHGLVLDSANHFDLQGMKRDVPGKASERRAMALDVLGYSYEEVRTLEERGAFKSAKKAPELLEDLSMFRLITNFVRQKRRAEL